MKRPYDHPLPMNAEAEKVILGAILLECSCSDKAEWMQQWKAALPLDPEDFALDSHRRIFLRMSELIDEGSAVDIVTLSNKLKDEKEIDNIGGVAYLASLTEGLPRRPTIKDYVRIVKAKSLQRRLIGVCAAAVEKAFSGESGFDIIAALKEGIEEIESAAKRGIRT